jgi:hypothetical protein
MIPRRMLLFGGLSLGLAACAGGRPMTVSTGEVEAPRKARVFVKEIDGDIFKFIVVNASDKPLVILRDEVILATPKGRRRRLSGGIAHRYTVPPSGAQDVNLRYDLSFLEPGDRLYIHFDHALVIGGERIDIDPIVIDVNGAEPEPEPPGPDL